MSSVPEFRIDLLRSLRASAIGNALEWFDWTIYGVFSVYLARNLFDAADPRSALLSTLAVFAGGFAARPLGGWAFGLFADRVGRKIAMVITMMTLAFSSVGIALIPNYADVGAFSSMLLLFFRLLQGLAHGGETGVSYTYVAEISPKERRGVWSSSVFVSVMIGIMAATGLAALLTSVFSAGAMNAHGWRIGFAAGGALGFYALYLRRSAVETELFTWERTAHKTPAPLPLRDLWKIARNIVLICAAANVTYYTWVTFAASLAIANGMNDAGAYWASLMAQILCLLWLPACGWISDKIGRKPMMVAWGGAVILLTYPIAKILTAEPMSLFFSQIMGLGAWALIASIFPAVLAEQAPTQARARGVGFVSSLSVAIFGGTAPYLNAYLTGLGHGDLYLWYVMFLGLLAVIAGIVIEETAGIDLKQVDASFVHLHEGRRFAKPERKG